MALSGSFYKNVGSHWRLQLEWTATQNIANNTSTVTAKLFWIALDSYGAVNSSSSKTCSIYMSGSNLTGAWNSTSGTLASLSGNQKKLIHTYSRTITHNDNGTGYVTLDAYFDAEVTLSGVYYGRIDIDAQTFTLDTIPRASSLSSSASWTAGNSLAISISRASSSFTHTVRIYAGTTLVKTITDIGASTTASFSTAENTTIFDVINAGASVGSKIELVTYSGSTPISTTTYTGTITAPSSSTTTSSMDFNIGASVAIGITRANAGFTHTLRFYLGSTLIHTETGVGTSFTWTPTATQITNMYNTTPKSNSIGSKVEIDTFYNGEKVRGTTSKTGTARVTNSNPIFAATSISYADTNTTTTGITGNNQYIIQNKSSLTAYVNTAASMRNGATFSHYLVMIDGKEQRITTTTGNVLVGTIKAGSNQSLIIRAYDSRGNFTEVVKTVLVVPYTDPVGTLTATRTNKFEDTTTISLKGSFSGILVGTNKNSLSLMQYRYKASTSSTWGAWTNFTYSTSGTSFTANNVVLTLANTQSWNLEIQIKDRLSTKTSSLLIGAGQPIMFIDSKKKSVGIGKFPVNSNSFEVEGRIFVTNSEGMRLQAPSSSNATYLTFFKDAGSPATRSGYVGFGSPTNNRLHIYNEMTGGEIYLYAQNGVRSVGDVIIEKGNPKLELKGTGSPGIELTSTNGGLPYIDFSNDSTSDYDIRVIQASDTSLEIQGGSLRIVNQPYLTTRNGSQSLSPNAWTILNHGTTSTNIGGGSITGGVYTIPESGVYQVVGVINMTTTSGTQYHMACFVNGVLSDGNRMHQRQASGTADGLIVGTTSIRLNKGDKIDVRVYQNSASTISTTTFDLTVTKLS